MSAHKNRDQDKVDQALRAAKERRELLDVAERALIAPESLDYTEIKRISSFVLAHQHCQALGNIRAQTTNGREPPAA